MDMDALVQSAVARPRSTGLAMIGMKSAGKGSDQVHFDSETFAVGAGSWNRGEPLTSLDYNSLVSAGRMAMFYAALSKSAVGKYPVYAGGWSACVAVAGRRTGQNSYRRAEIAEAGACFSVNGT